ncbi:flavoprotein [Chloropicon primus]|uniref:phosphopantothenoylcysteine decarboxylase n=1 Tax=Chloropicon primus TaxID=1764295 RepID=A0A5B8MV15_9CHLO|nr:flavoprotein [Chloropicon primus]UPR03607.1 flavoprotein [Chloropicon primus]|mmetsp:Transcript_6827/g.19944  ORF Transcript_6827/g.19944 Transcript_6827/m.19944 type:complete len:206 (+) Transcript_6827:206-823(+)|eukprot:QDZ24399.1 flavoprotein [Chloropicon primus]
MNVLVAATGSVASVKVPELVEEFVSRGNRVRVILSETACHFVTKQELVDHFEKRPTELFHPTADVYLEEDEWKTWGKMGDPVLHIELGKWAHVLVIAPLSANTLAKMVNGLCDNLITSVARAWDYCHGPVVAAPAMNTRMWTHPVTSDHIETLKRRDKIRIVDPVVKALACKDVGVGAMAPAGDVADAALDAIQEARERPKSDQR